MNELCLADQADPQRFGYSRDKCGTAYEMFPGNTTEKSTLRVVRQREGRLCSTPIEPRDPELI